jgi:hypothetical protein
MSASRRPLGLRPLRSLLGKLAVPPWPEPKPGARGPVPPAPPPSDAAAFFSSLLDLRSAVKVSSALIAAPAELPTGPIAEGMRVRAAAVIETLTEGTDQVLAAVSAVALRDAPRAMPLSAPSILGTLRATGMLEDPEGAALSRALRTLWFPYVGAVSDQAARAQRELDVLVSGASAALASIDPRLAALVALDAAIAEVTRAKVEKLLELPIENAGDQFADALVAAVQALPETVTARDLEPWLTPDAFIHRHLALAEEVLCARVAHACARPRALVEAVRGLLAPPARESLAAE